MRGREGRGGEGCSTSLPPRFDNPGYGPVRGGKGERGKGRRKGREGERDLAPQKKNSGAATGVYLFMPHTVIQCVSNKCPKFQWRIGTNFQLKFYR